ncbi:MAG TPA: radical SAM protein [Bacteroidota bacterium]|nr:radical SAM protein [Bacteroidota bacterium]
MNFKAWLNTVSTTSHTLPIVILYVTEGCNLHCCMCSYREARPGELSLNEIERLAGTLAAYGLRHIVYSGGEPLLRRDFPEICEIFSQYVVQQTLLTNGLLLEKRLREIRTFLNEIIVSLDGATPGTHNTIRGGISFEQILAGIRSAVQAAPEPRRVSIRTVVQKRNFRELAQLIGLAKSLGVGRISFLAADLLSDGFGRSGKGLPAPSDSIALTAEEVLEFRAIVDGIVPAYRKEFEAGFISESQDKLYHIVEYFGALIGRNPFPRNECNAPMVSAVITSTGDLLPCYFLPRFGNARETKLEQSLNNDGIIETRKKVRDYVLERCQTCVCTLRKSSTAALLDRF